MEPVAWVAWDPAFQSAILVMIFFWYLEDYQSSLSKCFPSGKHTKSDIENGPVEIVDFAIKHGGSFQFVMLVRLPEGNNHSWFIHL